MTDLKAFLAAVLILEAANRLLLADGRRTAAAQIIGFLVLALVAALGFRVFGTESPFLPCLLGLLLLNVIRLRLGLLATGDIGEVVIRGKNVTAGYLNNPEANAAAFTKGWFRTGDQGCLDDEGFLRLTGRLKEIINRGGEKISPREVDEVLLDHPSVAQALTFAVPHEKLGEDVAAAIVLKDGASATDKELRQFASGRLADFKVPRKILFLDEIPKGATGKLQRIGLAEKLGLT